MDGLQFAALDTLQHGLAGNAEREGRFEHRQPARGCVFDEQGAEFVVDADSPGSAGSVLLAGDEPVVDPAVQGGGRHSEGVGGAADREQLAVGWVFGRLVGGDVAVAAQSADDDRGEPLAGSGAAALAVIYTAMGACYFAGVKGVPMLVLVLSAIACYAMSLAPVTWVVISEIFPNRVRAGAMSVAVSALWIACFLLTYTFPILNGWLHPAGTFWLYAMICVVGFVFIKFKLPETKGKTLEEIERKLVD